MEVNLKETARYVQRRYGVKQVFVTGDGQAFLEDTYARMHAERKGLGLSSFNGALEETEIIPHRNAAVPQEPTGIKEPAATPATGDKETIKPETT